MKLSLIIEDLQSKLPILIRKYYPNLSPEEARKLIISLSELDPTPNKQYLDWLVNQHKRNNIRMPEDNENILQTLTQFHQSKSKLQVKDINQYKSPGDVAKAIDNINPTSNRELKLKGRKGELALPDGAKYLGENKGYQVVQILTYEAASILASGTEWCVANREWAEKYLNGGPLYLIYKDGKRAYLLHYKSDQLMDIYNHAVYNKWDILYAIQNLTGHEIRDWPWTAYEYATNIIKGRWPEGEPAIMKDPELAYKYAENIIKGRWPEGEPAIMKDQELAYQYAENIIKGRWPEAEPIIIKSIPLAYHYAKDIIKGRWLEAEPIIMKDPHLAYNYAHFIIKDRWPEAEPYIMKHPESICGYAENVIKGRWPEAEHTIIDKPKWVFKYANDAIKGRWPEAEPYIMKDLDFACYYAQYVIKGRWVKLERAIINKWKQIDKTISKYGESIDNHWFHHIDTGWYVKFLSCLGIYCNGVIGGRWPEIEPYISKDGHSSVAYARDVIKGRWPEGEPAILLDGEAIMEYVSSVTHGRWPEAEPYIIKDRDLWRQYVRAAGIDI